MNAPSRFDNRAKEEILSRIDIASVISRYVSLKSAGQNMKGLCPFHKEKTPSFSVNPSRGFFHCFGCGKGGDVFTFLMEIEGISFPEALKMLGDELGIDVSAGRAERPEPQAATTISKTEMLRIHEMARRFYYQQVKENPLAVDYFKQRGLKPEIVREFSLGYAPSGWSNLVAYAKSQGIVEASLIACGMALTKSDPGQAYDRFRNRIMFPLYDITGRCIALAGRSIDPQDMPKYLNSPETPIYHKSRTLYGLHKARPFIKEKGFLFIVEGYMDFLALYQAGIGNAVATSGTAFTADHVQIIRRFTDRVVLLFDGDSAGIKAAERGIFILAPFNLETRVLILPGEEDPDSYIKNFGAASFLELAQKAVPAATFIIQKAVSEHDKGSPQGKSAIITFLAPLIQSMSDSIVQHEFVKQLAEELDIAESLIYNKLNQAPKAGEGRTDKVSADAFLNTIEGRFLGLLTANPELIEAIEGRIAAEMFTDQFSAKLFLLIAQACREKLPFSNAISGEADPEARRILSALIVQPPPADNPQEELSHVIKRLERKYLKRRIREIGRMLGDKTESTEELLRKHKEFSQRLQELDAQP
jgi:DNA primase